MTIPRALRHKKYCRSMHDVTIELARRIAASSWPAVNDTVGDEAVRAVINWLGSALIGTRESFAEFDEASTGIGIEASALVMGRGFDALDIAAMTAAGAEALCYVDTHVPSMLSPSSAVGAALLPLAEHLTSTGAAFVHAYLLGIETACRAAMSVARHATHTSTLLACNALGATAACAHLAGLDVARTSTALSAAWHQATGQDTFKGCAASAARIALLATLAAKAGRMTDSTDELAIPASSSSEFTTDLIADWGQSVALYPPRLSCLSVCLLPPPGLRKPAYNSSAPTISPSGRSPQSRCGCRGNARSTIEKRIPPTLRMQDIRSNMSPPLHCSTAPSDWRSSSRRGYAALACARFARRCGRYRTSNCSTPRHMSASQ
jgi:hypothetical protein